MHSHSLPLLGLGSSTFTDGERYDGEYVMDMQVSESIGADVATVDSHCL